MRTWNMQELEVLEDSWHPQRADGARAAAEEAALRAHAAGGPSAAWAASEAPARPRSNTVGRDSKGAGGGAKAAGVAGKSAEIKRDDSQSPVAGRPSAGGRPADAPGGGSDLLSSILGGNCVAPPPATARKPSAPSAAETAEAEAARRLDAMRLCESRAAETVRKLHSAAATDTALPHSSARVKLLPVLGPIFVDPQMATPMLRAGVLGAIRRILQTTADAMITSPPQAARMRPVLFGMLRRLAPKVQAAHLRQSRGLGKLLMLIACSPSEPRTFREEASALLAAMLPSEEANEEASVELAGHARKRVKLEDA